MNSNGPTPTPEKPRPNFRKYHLYTRDSENEPWAYWGDTEPMSVEPEYLAARYNQYRGGLWKAEPVVLPNGATAMIQLQGVGWHSALPAKDLKPGMVIMWNHCQTSTVLEVKPHPSGKTLMITTKDDSNQYTRRYNSDRLLAVQDSAKEERPNA